MKKSYQRKNKKTRTRSKKGSGNQMTTPKSEEELIPYRSKNIEKEKYIQFLMDDKDSVSEITNQFNSILGREHQKNMENLTIEKQTYLSKYADEAELLRAYLKTVDMLLKLDETQSIPKDVKPTVVAILVLFKKYPFLIQLGSSSPQEELGNGDDIQTEDITRFEELIERVNQRIKKKEGGQKSRKKKRRPRKKSRRKKRKHQ
jgi:hypothetical protein